MKTQPSKHHTVIWADDDIDDLLMMRETLERLNQDHYVVETHNGQQVLDYLHSITNASQYPCLVILDVNMPVLNGRDTLVQIRSEEKFDHVPVVMFTTSSHEKDHAFCNRLGAKLYTKPSTMNEYEKVILKLLNHCSGQETVEHTASLFTSPGPRNGFPEKRKR